DPNQYEPVFGSLFEMTNNQSIYQTLLPPELQLREFLQGWLKDRTISKVLNRLKNAKVVEVEPNQFSCLTKDLGC
ncbi:MAG TPA: hypothetical protein PKV48_07365, partial [Thermodesulfobacteriota bacterium]|nr:hypothetical protein [Thermodesulfobacteriota bacterium]